MGLTVKCPCGGAVTIVGKIAGPPAICNDCKRPFVMLTPPTFVPIEGRPGDFNIQVGLGVGAPDHHDNSPASQVR